MSITLGEGRSPNGARPLRITIVGGSIAGVTAALLLARAGHDVAVYERSAGALSGRGAGIVTHPETHAVLGRCGLSVEPEELGVVVEGRRVLDRAGRIVAERALPQVLAGWGRLYGLLRDALPEGVLRGAANVTAIRHEADAVVARFDDGRMAAGDLLVGADGLFSTVRAGLLPAVAPAYAGYVAWRALADVRALSDETRDAICGHFAFCLPPGEQVLGYPVSAADAGDAPAPGSARERGGPRRFNVVWYRPAPAAELARLLTDARGVRHALSIPPNRIRDEVLSGMRADAQRLLAPPFAEAVLRTAQPFLQPILDVETTSMAPGPRVALIGDAAFVARPHVGMGVTKAMADAAALADALAVGGDVDTALGAFDARRRPYGAAIVARSRALGAYMQAQQLSEAERAAAERHRSPEAVMAETAVAPVLPFG